MRGCRLGAPAPFPRQAGPPPRRPEAPLAASRRRALLRSTCHSALWARLRPGTLGRRAGLRVACCGGCFLCQLACSHAPQPRRCAAAAAAGVRVCACLRLLICHGRAALPIAGGRAARCVAAAGASKSGTASSVDCASGVAGLAEGGSDRMHCIRGSPNTRMHAGARAEARSIGRISSVCEVRRSAARLAGCRL